MNTSDVPYKVYVKAIDLARKYSSNWPEDEWIPVGIDFELNLFTQDDGTKCATIYRVEDNKTLTNDFVRIYTQKAIEPRLKP